MVRKRALIFIALCAISLAFSLKSKPVDQSGFALVELFTSEGCSSCPPADALIAEIEKESKDKPVYILAYHVDYWDRLGWKDSFSDQRYSQRQYQYANWLKLSGVYTPQILVNGTQEFVGSEEKTLRTSIRSAIAEKSKNKLEISIQKQSGAVLTLTYHSDQSTQGYNLNVAFVTPHAINRIERGENKGKSLSHVQIVRTFESIPLKGRKNGQINFSVVKGVLQVDAEPIGFLQNAETGKITAATQLKIKAAHS